ncbi:hypothetical protein, partial [Mycoplasmopsis bovis]
MPKEYIKPIQKGLED